MGDLTLSRFAVLVLTLAACTRPPQPSVVLVTIDTLRADHVGCYGRREARTPNLDRLAAQGVLFEEARSHVPLTAPSHATILTGLLPPEHGVRGNGPFRLRDDARTLASALRANGYRTAAVVGSVVLDRAVGLESGFDVYDDNQRVGPKIAFRYLERGASQIESASVAALAKLEPPFFLWVHFYDPHVPWVAPPAFGRGYDAEIAFVDAALGNVLTAARSRAGPELVTIVTSDHGESLGEHGENQHGYTLHRGVLRVPLIVAGARLPRGRRVTNTVGLVDLAPTIAKLAGCELPGASGRSLDRLGWGRRHVDDAELWEESLHPLFDSGWAPLRGLVGPRWHLVEAPRPELYDRVADPGDRSDVAASNPDVVAKLRARLHALGASLGDVEEPEVHAATTPEERERRERLASLGYLAAPGSKSSRARLDPKDGLPGFLAVEEAERVLEAGDASRARDLVEPHLSRDPDNPRLWHTLSKARLTLGDPDGAHEAIARALGLSPGGEHLRYTEAEILARRSDTKGAVAVLQAIVRDNPRAVEASLRLAAIQGGGAPLLAAYEAGARDPELLDALGRHAAAEGRETEARAFYEQALALWPEDPAALLALGQSDLRGGHPIRAIERLRTCVAFECRIELARAYVVGPRDLAAARRELVAAREMTRDSRLLHEVDRRLAALEEMTP